jgi:hypothetical protein
VGREQRRGRGTERAQHVPDGVLCARTEAKKGAAGSLACATSARRQDSAVQDTGDKGMPAPLLLLALFVYLIAAFVYCDKLLSP